jgi:hypothetical protein
MCRRKRACRAHTRIGWRTPRCRKAPRPRMRLQPRSCPQTRRPLLPVTPCTLACGYRRRSLLSTRPNRTIRQHSHRTPVCCKAHGPGNHRQPNRPPRRSQLLSPPRMAASACLRCTSPSTHPSRHSCQYSPLLQDTHLCCMPVSLYRLGKLLHRSQPLSTPCMTASACLRHMQPSNPPSRRSCPHNPQQLQKHTLLCCMPLKYRLDTPPRRSQLLSPPRMAASACLRCTSPSTHPMHPSCQCSQPPQDTRLCCMPVTLYRLGRPPRRSQLLSPPRMTASACLRRMSPSTHPVAIAASTVHRSVRTRVCVACLIVNSSCRACCPAVLSLSRRCVLPRL